MTEVKTPNGGDGSEPVTLPYDQAVEIATGNSRVGSVEQFDSLGLTASQITRVSNGTYRGPNGRPIKTVEAEAILAKADPANFKLSPEEVADARRTLSTLAEGKLPEGVKRDFNKGLSQQIKEEKDVLEAQIALSYALQTREASAARQRGQEARDKAKVVRKDLGLDSDSQESAVQHELNNTYKKYYDKTLELLEDTVQQQIASLKGDKVVRHHMAEQIRMEARKTARAWADIQVEARKVQIKAAGGPAALPGLVKHETEEKRVMEEALAARQAKEAREARAAKRAAKEEARKQAFKEHIGSGQQKVTTQKVREPIIEGDSPKKPGHIDSKDWWAMDGDKRREIARLRSEVLFGGGPEVPSLMWDPFEDDVPSGNPPTPPVVSFDKNVTDSIDAPPLTTTGSSVAPEIAGWLPLAPVAPERNPDPVEAMVARSRPGQIIFARDGEPDHYDRMVTSAGKYNYVAGTAFRPDGYSAGECEDAIFIGENAFAVIDGMGGYSGGQVAARRNNGYISDIIKNRREINSINDAENVIREIFEGLDHVDRSAGGEAVGTLGLIVDGDHSHSKFVVVGTKGDTRALVISADGAIFNITEDESIDGKVLSYIGDGKGVAIRRLELMEGDKVILASDGIFGDVESQWWADDPAHAGKGSRLSEIGLKGMTAEEAAAYLLAKSIKPDDKSVIVIDPFNRKDEKAVDNEYEEKKYSHLPPPPSSAGSTGAFDKPGRRRGFWNRRNKVVATAMGGVAMVALALGVALSGSDGNGEVARPAPESTEMFATGTTTAPDGPILGGLVGGGSGTTPDSEPSSNAESFSRAVENQKVEVAKRARELGYKLSEDKVNRIVSDRSMRLFGDRGNYEKYSSASPEARQAISDAEIIYVAREK